MAKQLSEVQKFKNVLERFVAYIEHLQSIKDSKEDKNFIKPKQDGRETVWNEINSSLQGPTKKSSKENISYPLSGHGYKNDAIQDILKDVDKYDCGKICLNITNNHGQGYDTQSTMLHWHLGYLNIFAHWENNKVHSLVITPGGSSNSGDVETWLKDKAKQTDYSFTDHNRKYTVKDLELFDGKDPNDQVRKMYEVYKSWYNFYKPFFICQQLEYVTKLLETNYNLILTGAPGTGKTFMAKNIAAKLTFKDCDHDYANYEIWKDKDKFEKQVGFAQFHPSYDYTDFVEGLRPYDDGKGNIGFKRQDGVFKQFCKKALNDKDNKYIFIIDEINRGELNKIFGELFFSIDPSYRGERGKTNTQYQNLVDYERDEKGEKIQIEDPKGQECPKDAKYKEDIFKGGFYVPENVYIIGTMNDIDRSVDSMDFAIRRRFAWKEVLAEDTVIMLDTLTLGKPEDKYAIIDHMNHLNDEILKVFGSTSYQIGPSYFLKIEKYLDNEKATNNSYKKLWDYHLCGVLQEYVRGRNDAKQLMKQFKDAYDGNTNSDSEEDNEEESNN